MFHLQVGEQTRPLTMASIEEYLRDFGLEPEFGTHSNIRGLSGGQKVKANDENIRMTWPLECKRFNANAMLSQPHR